MPTANEFWEVAAQVASERGGLVVGFAGVGTQPELGSTLDNVFGFTASGPVRVASVSDSTDWNEQVDAFYRLRPSWGRGKAGDPDAKYYRVRLPAPVLIRTEESAINALPSFSPRLTIPSLSRYAAPAGKFKGATFWPRAAARIVDYVLLYFAGLFAGVLFGVLLAVAFGGRLPAWVLARISRAHLPVYAASLLGFLAYSAICDSIHGSTLGKLLLSLQVLQEDGSSCRPQSAIIREVAYFVDALFFGFIGYSAMKDTDEQQRYGDQWAHTIVCKRSDVPPDSRQSTMRFVLGLMLGLCADVALLMTGLLVQMNT